MAGTTTRWRTVDPLRPGDPREVAGFEVVGRLGEGGMGVVFLARHPEHGPAALKFVRSAGPVAADDPSFRARFGREIEAARRVRSPRAARVLAADPDAAVPWLATAFVDGPTLQEAVAADGPMDGERLVSLAVALADALASVHEAGVVHRDLKPRNILLTADTPVVIDFGIASLREAPQLTRTGAALGTPGWMAPEQVQGRPCGPATDVFGWGAVVAFAAGGRPPFGEGSADALLYRIVHEPPAVPALPPALDGLVQAALDKDPARRPSLDQILAALTGAAIDETRAGATALGATQVERTAVVPTIVALGWDVEALPTRPDGRPREVPTGVAVGRPERPADAVAASAFWYAGEDHHDPRTLAAAFQALWDDAIDQVFGRRNPVWIDELRGFLRAAGNDEAERLVGAGAGESPPAVAMARLLLALDPRLEPRVGPIRLTPDGLVAAAEAVATGGEPAGPMRARVDGAGGPGGPSRTAELLAEIGSSRILRLWRGLPGMERAAAIDERWHAWTEAFGRYVARVAPHAGWPSPDESQRAAATLLLCAVHPEHEGQLDRRLAAARRTAARHQVWWAQLAAEGQRNPPAAVLAVMTADRARTATLDERAAARAAERERREAERAARARREAARPAPPVAAAWPPAPGPSPVAIQPRFVPLRRAGGSAASGWWLLVSMVGLAGYLWATGNLGDMLVAHHQGRVAAGAGSAGSMSAAEDARAATGWAVLLLVVLPVGFVLTRWLMTTGTSRAWVRAYAAGAAVVDLVVGLVLIRAATFAVLVLEAGADGALDPGAPGPFGDESWGGVALLLPYGLVGAWLVVRSVWRLGRAVFGRPVAAPFFGRGVPAWR